MGNRPASSRSRRNGAAPKGLLKEQAYREIKRLIQDGEFPPGELLSERQLAARLGMSKTPIRAALEHLGAQGLLTVSPQQGITVRDLSLQEAGNLFELRMAIEPFVVKQLSGKLSAPQIDRLRANLERQQRAAVIDDPFEEARSDIEFHLLLCEFLGNPEVTHPMRHALDKLYRTVVRLFVQSVGRAETNVAEHAGIVEAVDSGAPDLAARRMEEHLQFGWQFQRIGRAGDAGPRGRDAVGRWNNRVQR